MALNTPDTFKRLFIKSVKPNGDLVIKHKDTNVSCQIAIKIDTYSDSKDEKQKGGSGRATTRRNKNIPSQNQNQDLEKVVEIKRRGGK